MSSSPAFAATPRIGVGSVSTANTNRDGSGTLVDIITGAANGTKINEIVVQATGNPADSIVTLFLYDGTTNWLFSEMALGDPAAAATNVAGYRANRLFDNVVLPNSSWKLRAGITVALTSGVMNVFALGGDL